MSKSVLHSFVTVQHLYHSCATIFCHNRIPAPQLRHKVIFMSFFHMLDFADSYPINSEIPYNNALLSIPKRPQMTLLDLA